MTPENKLNFISDARLGLAAQENTKKVVKATQGKSRESA
jgi:hypothetical protein